jgi:chromosome segregation ATPase
MKIRAEIDALEARVQKGKIPRRRYKVQKKTLEMRVDTLSRNLGELKESMRSAGGHYADLMRQFDVAETEINDVEANIKNIEARQNRGEITLELYRNRMEEYRHRKEKAETMIDGILLRLREETR